MPSSHFIPCHPLLLLPSIFPSIRVFSDESVLCIRWPKYWSFSFSFSPSNEYTALISFRMDWLDLLAVQGTLKSLLQHHSSKASVLQLSAFFTVQLSHPYMTTGKPIALTRQVTTFILRIQESVQLHLFICFVFQLPNRSHMVYVFLSYVTEMTMPQAHPYCCRWQDFILFVTEQHSTAYIYHTY